MVSVCVCICLEVGKRITVLAIKLQWLFSRNVCAWFIVQWSGVVLPGQCPGRPAQDFRLRTHTHAALMRMKRQAVRSLKMVRALTNMCVLVQ